jgi:hypothetical protein
MSDRLQHQPADIDKGQAPIVMDDGEPLELLSRVSELKQDRHRVRIRSHRLG